MTECEHTQLPSLSVQKSPRTNDSGGRNVTTHMPPLSIQISPRTNDSGGRNVATHMPPLCHRSTSSPSALSGIQKRGVTVLEGGRVLARGTGSCT